MERWNGIERPYSTEEVERLRGTIRIEHTLARLGAERLWQLLQEEDYVGALGAMTGGQAVQMVKAGLKAVYLSGWPGGADGDLVERRAGRGGWEPARAGLSRPEPLPHDERVCPRPPPEQRFAPSRPDR